MVQSSSHTLNSESRGGPVGQCPQRYSPHSSTCLQPGPGEPVTLKGDPILSGDYGHQGIVDKESEALCFGPGFVTFLVWIGLS